MKMGMEVFERMLGLERVRAILSEMGTAPVVLIAGAQASGKSTVAKEIARATGVEVMSTGAIVRGLAGNLAAVRSAPFGAFDVQVDAGIAREVARGSARVFEGRMAGFIGSWLRAKGRAGLLRVRLDAGCGERARRLLGRELGIEVERRQANEATATAGSVFEALVALAPIVPERAVAVRDLADRLGRRDENDREGLRRVYGVEWDGGCWFDVTFDSGITSPTLLAASILAASKVTA